ncbi:MAG: glycogen debranching protein GlgX [Acidobacteriota bacterium]
MSGDVGSSGGRRFELRSASASSVALCLFEAGGERHPKRVVPMTRGDDDTWSATVDEIESSQRYLFEVTGRRGRSRRVLDPRALAITSGHDGSRHCVRVDEPAPREVPALERSWSDTVIYEAHVKGLTRRHPEVPEHLRGTYLGLVSPPILEHLRQLGVTAVELLPIHHFVSEPRLLRLGLTNYWGYSPIGFFAPHADYATGDEGQQLAEFCEMARRLREEGFELILDTCFGHTAEGPAGGPTLSFRGIDEDVFYRRRPDGRLEDWSGCGNSLDPDEPRVRELFLDSLRTWMRRGVDGFRFDQAPILFRRDGEFRADAPLFEAIAADPLLSRAKLIAEPWDLGPDGYRLGGFPEGWSEWNGKYRDTVRSAWRGDQGQLPELATRLSGSEDLFSDRAPSASINFITCHDGYTLQDLVSHRRKHNGLNGESNRDGHDDNRSCHWGLEGATDHPAIRRRRRRARRNLLATLALSRGVPMLAHGDELLRTHHGNNNAYCHDSPLTWVDWTSTPEREEHHDFLRRLLRLRSEMEVLRRDVFLTGRPVESGGPPDVSWCRADGELLAREDWNDPTLPGFGMLLPDSSTAGAPAPQVLVILNRSLDRLVFRLPVPSSGGWELALTTANRPAPRRQGAIVVAPLSIAVLRTGSSDVTT